MHYIQFLSCLLLISSSILLSSDKHRSQSPQYNLEKDNFIRDINNFSPEDSAIYAANRKEYLARKASEPVESQLLKKRLTQPIAQQIINQNLIEIQQFLDDNGTLFCISAFTEQDKLGLTALALEKYTNTADNYEIIPWQSFNAADRPTIIEIKNKELSQAKTIYTVIKKAVA